jgi:hypothetical protein
VEIAGLKPGRTGSSTDLLGQGSGRRRDRVRGHGLHRAAASRQAEPGASAFQALVLPPAQCAASLPPSAQDS